MGNILTSALCFQPGPQRSLVKLVFWGGTTQFITDRRVAGEVMFDFPDRIICHADSFFIGRPLPILDLEDELRSGETYFVLPLDQFPHNTNLTVASLASLSPARPCTPPFEYVKAPDGRTLIKVVPDFIARAISGDEEKVSDDTIGGSLCSTPELQKQYKQLVGSREQSWSPKLETILEGRNSRVSPGRLLVCGGGGSDAFSPRRR